MVTSGNSSRSSESTSPIDRWFRSGIALPVLHLVQEHQPELPDLQFVAAVQVSLFDPLSIEVGAVETADVVDGEGGAIVVHLGMPAGHGDVIEKDVAVRVTADRGL